jgi:uncharacterized membrane protein YhaH (DUF805 family)
MQIPTIRQIQEGFCDFWRYTWAVLCHYILVVGGVLLGAILTLYPNIYQGARVSGWWISGILIFIATFLAWRQQYLDARHLHDIQMPKLEVAYDESKDCKCDMRPPRSGVPFVFLRLLVTTESISEIKNCQGHITRIERDNQKIWSGMTLLTFAPEEDDDATDKTIRHGYNYHLDVIAIGEIRVLFLGTKGRHWPSFFTPVGEIFSQKGDYFLTINVSGASTTISKRVRLYIADNYRDCALEMT